MRNIPDYSRMRWAKKVSRQRINKENKLIEDEVEKAGATRSKGGIIVPLILLGAIIGFLGYMLFWA